MKKLLAILLSFILVIGTVIGVNAVVYYYGAGGPDMTLNFYIDSSKVPTTTFTEIEMKIFSSFNTYADMIKLYDKWSFLGNVKVESSLEGAELYTGYTEKQGAVTIFKFKSEEGFEIADNQPFLSITNVNATLYTGNDSIDYIVNKLVGSNGTDYADKDAVTTNLKIPEGTYYTHPCEGALKVNNLRDTEATEPTVTEPSSETQMTEPATEPSTATEPTEASTSAPAANISKTEASVKAGGTVTLKVTDGTVKTWSTSNKAVATVSKGKVTGLKKGSATITAALTTGKKLTCKVTVTTLPELSKSSVSVKKGKTVSVKITGKALTVKNVYTNTKIAKVVSKNTTTTIKVKGLKKGSTILKIKVNGVVLKLKVKVK